MGKMVNKLLYIILALCLSAPLASASLDLSLAGVGARPMALGQAYTAVADDTNAVFTNPAGLGGQNSWGITTMSTKLLNRVDYKLVGAVYPTELGTFGIGYLSASTPAGYLTTDKVSISSASAISYGSSMINLSYGRDLSEAMHMNSTLGKLYVGANVKALSSTFNGVDGTGNGSSCDVGLIFKPNDRLSTGLTFKNIGSNITWNSGADEKLARSLNAGAAYNFDRGLASLDLQMGGGLSLLRGGIEYQPFNLLVLRAGLNQSVTGLNETANNLSGGVGVKLNGFTFDYAYRQDSTLGDNSAHYISISFQPETITKKVAVKPQEKTDKEAENKLYLDPQKADGIFKVAGKTQAKGILSFYE